MLDRHLEDTTLAALLERRLSSAEQARLHEHIERCPACRELVVSVAGSDWASTESELQPVEASQAATPPRIALTDTASASDTDPPASTSFVPPVRLDEFRIVRPLGRGAMGQVFLAQDTALSRSVAIKFVSAATLDEDQRQRFQTEARAIARIAHPNVVSVHRIGEYQGRPYLVSEFVKGKSLDQLPKPVPWQRVVSIGIALADGLAAAHRRGVLHRDIKPANAMEAEDGSVKLLDFGLAQVTEPAWSGQALPVDASGGDASASVTGLAQPLSGQSTSAIVGTPLYLAPERWRSEPASVQSDVYSLAAVLYELCTGLPLFSPVSLEELQQLVQRGSQPWRARLESVPGVDRRLVDMIARCLSAVPAERLQSADALAAELRQIGQGRQVRSNRSNVFLLAILISASIISVIIVLRLLSKRQLPPPPPAGMVRVPGGVFRMGSTVEEIASAHIQCEQQDPEHCCNPEIFQREQPRHQVSVSDFYMDHTEVTVGEFVAWMNSLPQLQPREQPTHESMTYDCTTKAFKPGVPKVYKWLFLNQIAIIRVEPENLIKNGIEIQAGKYTANNESRNKPIGIVTWDAADRYCRDHGKRLPTEAEWEYAARGIEGRLYPWGSQEPTCAGVAFGRWPGMSCADSSTPTGPKDVGTSPQDRSPTGIYDLGGNVSEWVKNSFAEYKPCGRTDRPCIDPGSDAAEGDANTQAVMRGGSWALTAVFARGAGRGKRYATETFSDIGFRCVVSTR